MKKKIEKRRETDDLRMTIYACPAVAELVEASVAEGIDEWKNLRCGTCGD
jgi:hypothetical protein